MWRADAHFRTGSSHDAEGSPCQDYALADNGPLPFAVVSDGCSTSGRTDIGARLWCLAAERVHCFAADAEDYLNFMVPKVSGFRDVLGLVRADLDATVGVIFALRDKTVRTILFGDGIIVAKLNSRLEIVVVEWAGNMPGYPSYAMTFADRTQFLCQSESLADDGDACCSIARKTAWADGETDTGTALLSARDGLRGIEIDWPADTEIAAIITDGIGQISGIDLHTAVADLMSFGAAREGAFAKRRLNAAIKRWAKDGHRPVDDISIAALVRVPDAV